MKTTPQSSPAQPRAPSLRVVAPAGPGAASSRIPIAQQWERLNNGLPGSSLTTDYYAQALRQLLDTPLGALYAQEDDASKRWNKRLTFALTSDELSRFATPSLDAQGRPLATYKDALTLARDLVEEMMRYDFYSCEQLDLKRCCDSILIGLAHLLLQSPEPLTKGTFGKGEVISIAERLAHIGAREHANVPASQILNGKSNTKWNGIMQNAVRSREYPILAAPLSHYLCAASGMYGNDLPLRAGRRFFKAFLAPGAGNIMFNLATMLKIGLKETPLSKKPLPGAREPEPDCNLLYNLLVAPVFPDEDADDEDEKE